MESPQPCAGKRNSPRAVDAPPRKNHPRMRREEWASRLCGSRRWESPPHARGRVSGQANRTASSWNHPRIRGEEMRGFAAMAHGFGITPACAGKSCSSGAFRGRGMRNHPRVRGEEWYCPFSGRQSAGITPACAGKSGDGRAGGDRRRNYPRARGEEADRGLRRLCRQGITPACAGKRVMKMRPPRIWPYPLSANFPLFSKSRLQAPRDSKARDRRLFGYQASCRTVRYAESPPRTRGRE